MRLKVVLRLRFEKGSVIPWNYLDALRGLLFQAMAKASPRLASQVHDMGLEGGGKVYKLLTFSLLYPRRKRTHLLCGSTTRSLKNGIFLSGEALWFVSSPLGGVMEVFAFGLLEMGSAHIAQASCEISRVEVLPERQFGKEDLFFTLSPIVVSTGVREGEKFVEKFLSSDMPDFARILYLNLIRKYQALHGREPEGSIQFEFLSPFKSKLFEVSGTKVRGFQMRLKMKGSPEMIKLAYDAGLGERTTQGFGIVELLSERSGQEGEGKK